MENRYLFREAEKIDVKNVFQLILERMQWMDKKAITQWNSAHYDQIYPLSYYETKREAGELFVLWDTCHQEIVSAGVLLEQDERWSDPSPSLYLHNFVSKLSSNAGANFLKYAELLAKQKQKQFLRLDCAIHNSKLASYYEKLGFQAVGTCKEGDYKGILQQKKIS